MGWAVGPAVGQAVGQAVGLALLALLAAGAVAAVQDPLLNVCMDAKHHKRQPGPEGQLYGQVGAAAGLGAQPGPPLPASAYFGLLWACPPLT